MKSLKMLGLAAFAALMAMALLGASSAMATNTQICMNDEDPCQAANVISHIHEETVTGAKLKWLSTLGNIECNALFLGDTLGLGAPLIIHGNFTYTSCVKGKESCTAIEEGAEEGPNTLIELLRTGADTASVTEEFELHVHCGLFINCTYDGEGLAGIAKGALAAPTNGETVFSEAVLHKLSGLCPEVAKLDSRTTPLLAGYIVS